MIDNEYDRMIQRYLDEEMTETERVDFETELYQKETLRQRLEEYQSIAEGIRYQGEQEAWQKVRALEAEVANFESENHPNVTKWLFRGVAASLLLLIVGVPYYWNPDERVYARLFEKHYEPYQALGGANRGEQDGAWVLPAAFEAYYEKQYEQAIELFRQASTQEDRPYVWLYLGNAYLSNNQPQEATEALQHALTYQDIDERTRLRTHWDLGMAYLKLNNKEEATRHFEIIKNTEDYGPKVKDILDSIY